MKDFQITENTRLYKIRNYPKFKEFKKILFTPRKWAACMGVYKIKHLKLFMCYDPFSIADGFNFLKEEVDKNKKIYYSFGKDKGLFAFPVKSKKPYILILPGGGYHEVCAMVEGFPLAKYFNSLGYSVFVGIYGIDKNAKFPGPHQDVSNFLNFIEQNFDVQKGKYILSGFSAGGHLASSFALKNVGYGKFNNEKPLGLLLGYPLISLNADCKEITRKRLFGEENFNNKELLEKYSVDVALDETYPLTYFFQSKDDTVLSINHAHRFNEALNKANVKHKFIEIDKIDHGFPLGRGTKAEGWLKEGVEAIIKNYENK